MNGCIYLNLYVVAYNMYSHIRSSFCLIYIVLPFKGMVVILKYIVLLLLQIFVRLAFFLIFVFFFSSRSCP